MSTSNHVSAKSSPYYYFHFGLIVTGESEREHLPKLFKSLMETGICTFRVIRFTGQRSPITSAKRKLAMVGSGKLISDKDAEEIGFPARRYLTLGQCHLVVLVDDLEHDRRAQAQQVFDRYRSIFDTVLITDEQKRRAAVHFLVNMLEAYYLADAGAINTVLGLNPPLEDYQKDVETIRNPKGYIRERCPAFDEIEHGGKILDLVDVERVLSRPDTCAWLRTLFAWCVKVLEQYPDHTSLSLADKYCLWDGALSPVTRVQLDHF
jgi:hypothetical protein